MKKIGGLLVSLFLFGMAILNLGLNINDVYKTPEEEHDLLNEASKIRKTVQKQSDFEFALLLNSWTRVVNSKEKNYISKIPL